MSAPRNLDSMASPSNATGSLTVIHVRTIGWRQMPHAKLVRKKVVVLPHLGYNEVQPPLHAKGGYRYHLFRAGFSSHPYSKGRPERLYARG